MIKIFIINTTTESFLIHSNWKLQKIWLSKTKLQKSDEIFLWFMCDLNIYYAGDFVQSYH